MEQEYKDQIAAQFWDCINRTIERLENTETNRPFHSALLSPDALFWSRFERSFSTSFGQKVIEQVSKIVALSGGATECTTQKETSCAIHEGQINAIDSHITNLRSGSRLAPPNWLQDLERIEAIPKTDSTHAIRVVSDLFWVKDGVKNYMSIKTVKPNIDQTAEAKRDLLKLKIHDPTCKVYFGLYYNPYGENKQDYIWSPPRTIFNIQQDEVVLIGKDYWDVLGGTGSYEEVLAIANACGEVTRAQIGKLNN